MPNIIKHPAKKTSIPVIKSIPYPGGEHHSHWKKGEVPKGAKILNGWILPKSKGELAKLRKK